MPDIPLFFDPDGAYQHGLVLLAESPGPDYEAALAAFKQAARRGHAQAMTLYARMRDLGLGALPDKAEAEAWWRKAAEAGDPVAQGEMAARAVAGKVDLDGDTRGAWALAAAEGGDPQGQRELGRALLNTGGAQDEARGWLRKAAEAEDVQAQVLLAGALEEGIGGPRDFEGAARWYLAAAKRGDQGAATRLADLALGALDRVGEATRALALPVLAELAPENAAVATALARFRGERPARLTPEQAAALGLDLAGALAGDARAQFLIAAAYEVGLDGLEDPGEMVGWYERAAAGGSADALAALGTLYVKGERVEPDPVKAVTWLRLAAERLDAVEAAARLMVPHHLAALEPTLTLPERRAADAAVAAWKAGRN